MRQVDGILDAPPYTVDGAVVTIPRGYQLQPGYQYPQPVYDADLGRASALFPTLSQDDFRFIMLGIFVLLALAIVTRK